MPSARCFQFVILLFGLAMVLQVAVAQVVVATVPAASGPYAVAVNPVSNQIYITNQNSNNVTVIDGATNNTSTVSVGNIPYGVAVNPITNKIYVVNGCGNDPSCSSAGTVTVIDGATNNTTTVNVGAYPLGVGVDSVTNQIYVVNNCGNDLTCSSAGTVTVIDGATNNTASVNVGNFPQDVEVNSVTNQMYVTNNCGDDNTCGSSGTVTVIDGASNNTTTVNVGFFPNFAAVNSVTNEIYVVNVCGNDLSCSSAGTVTVVNGATNNTATINVGNQPYGIGVNSVANKIYVANNCGNDVSCASAGNVTVIDGSTNNTLTVNVGYFPYFAAVDSITNEVYVTNSCGNDSTCNSAGTVSVIDGATNSVVPVAVGDAPFGVAANATSDRIYVLNYDDGTVSVLAGDVTLQFVPVTPCRVVDTRQANGPFGGPPILGGTYRSFPIPQNTNCNIPSSAAAYSLNVTVVPFTTLGYLTIWPTSLMRPVVSTMNSPDGRIKANATIVPAGVSGAVSVYVTDYSDAILDIDGYFAPAASNTYQFYPLTPCRIVDTRNNQDGGMLQAGVERDYTIPPNCDVPSSATAYSFNVTVLPSAGGLDYLTVWPEGETQPVVSTLNDNTGTVVANAAIVPAGSQNATAFYAHNNSTNLLVDIDGYFAAPGSGGLSMYPVAPCRVLDTRQNNGQPFVGELPVNVVGSACAPPVRAQAYIFNATVVPPGSMPYLTLWPDGEHQPVVSTLNAYDGFITSNMAIVPTNNGSIDAYAAGLTQLILDISGYFAP